MRCPPIGHILTVTSGIRKGRKCRQKGRKWIARLAFRMMNGAALSMVEQCIKTSPPFTIRRVGNRASTLIDNGKQLWIERGEENCGTVRISGYKSAQPVFESTQLLVPSICLSTIPTLRPRQVCSDAKFFCDHKAECCQHACRGNSSKQSNSICL